MDVLVIDYGAVVEPPYTGQHVLQLPGRNPFAALARNRWRRRIRRTSTEKRAA